MTSSAEIDRHVQELIEAATRAAAAGNARDADQLLGQAQSFAPDHPSVLNALAMRALQDGDFASGRHYMEHAVDIDPNAPLLWFHLALMCRGQRDIAAETRALERTLSLDPYYFMALLQKATLLERQGKSKQAALAFGAFLRSLPTSAQQSAALQPAIAHARKSLAANNAALESFLRASTQSVRERYESTPLDRFDDCLDVLLEKKRVYVQQPHFMHFPYLPAVQFYARSHFPWFGELEAGTNDIRTEFLRLLTEDAHGMVPYVSYAEGTPLNQWKDLNHSAAWSAYYLWKEGAPLADHINCCPKTAAILQRLPLADIPGHAPTVFFSILKPNTHIPAHTGVTNTRLVVHLPLVIPRACCFRVGSETREWVLGKAWAFDDTIEHEAWNNSDQLRAILIIDIWNPYLTAAERELVSAATVAFGAYYRD